MNVPTAATGFRDRADAAARLAELLRGRPLRDPLVLAVPRGGVVTGAGLARELGAELDVVLARKLRAPFQPEYAIGAVSEDGRVVLNPDAGRAAGMTDEWVEAEVGRQLDEIARRRESVRAVRPAARVADRSVIVTDDGIATGSTVLAAIRAVRAQRPHEIILAVPVAPPERLRELRRFCDDAVCLLTPDDFSAVGVYYADFGQVGDDEVLRLLREAADVATPRAAE